ncbi:hypothetical protein A3F66_03190 [candidate division TM6 bacterium RIFCSPHIGHO2_12_FULL_32_22]|nr:MAG: hypothetical protein A3F66_03190 [candidate division TM6 bacterium RIFCSPHIGHO2_12_FULL_32_22]
MKKLFLLLSAFLAISNLNCQGLFSAPVLANFELGFTVYDITCPSAGAGESAPDKYAAKFDNPNYGGIGGARYCYIIKRPTN